MTYKDVLPIWWSFTWRGILSGAAAGFVVGFIVGLVFHLIGQSDIARTASALLGGMAGIATSIWAMRSALIKHSLQLPA